MMSRKNSLRKGLAAFALAAVALTGCARSHQAAHASGQPIPQDPRPAVECLWLPGHPDCFTITNASRS